MIGKVALEEAFNLPDIVQATIADDAIYVSPEYKKEYVKIISDITDFRLQQKDKYGVGYTVLSHTVPGVQGECDQQKAERLATRVNDWVAEQIKEHRDRYGAFAALSMHDPKQAGEELRRCVTQHGFHGALLNDVQYAGENGEKILFYDQPEYDAFWSVVQELDVPIYIHPAAPRGALYDLQYAQRKFLVGPPLSFANGVSLHLLGIVSNGVFDRFPKLQIIVGHLGEHIPFDLWRINHWFEDVEKPLGMRCKKTLGEYFQQNIWITTSGHFSTETLNYCISQIGADRILFSIDYPYETFEMACDWYDNHTQMNLGDKIKIGRENAKKLLKIKEYKDCNAEVTE